MLSVHECSNQMNYRHLQNSLQSNTSSYSSDSHSSYGSMARKAAAMGCGEVLLTESHFRKVNATSVIDLLHLLDRVQF